MFESILCDSIYKFVHSTLAEQQHGFVPEQSTASNLCVFNDFCSDAIENKKQLDVIFTDVEKAFDRVNHQLLLRKLVSIRFFKNVVAFYQKKLTQW